MVRRSGEAPSTKSTRRSVMGISTTISGQRFAKQLALQLAHLLPIASSRSTAQQVIGPTTSTVEQADHLAARRRCSQQELTRLAGPFLAHCSVALLILPPA